ncbi:hypothetical protein ABRY23_05060 [Melioribacteraceae bacterium 4301-Me]|uniref:hypothetical protein n=1 Tax=Pyranulibacter aquaticus TaxID=3163344 RepID=UPI00359ABC12
MTFKDQKKYFEILQRYEKKFDKAENEDYRMLLKRHKDDEELDKLSLERLEKLYIKYHASREKKNFDQYFKKN